MQSLHYRLTNLSSLHHSFIPSFHSPLPCDSLHGTLGCVSVTCPLCCASSSTGATSGHGRPCPLSCRRMGTCCAARGGSRLPADTSWSTTSYQTNLSVMFTLPHHPGQNPAGQGNVAASVSLVWFSNPHAPDASCVTGSCRGTVKWRHSRPQHPHATSSAQKRRRRMRTHRTVKDKNQQMPHSSPTQGGGSSGRSGPSTAGMPNTASHHTAESSVPTPNPHHPDPETRRG